LQIREKGFTAAGLNGLSQAVNTGLGKLPTGLDLIVLDCVKHLFDSPHFGFLWFSAF
jgi:hypothetical protein